jgi:hypothetical protein
MDHAKSVPWFMLLALLPIAAVLPSTSGCSSAESAEPNYLIGGGSADITGPLVDVAFTGYSQPSAKAP